MAKVTLQVQVNRQQVDQLVSDVNKLDGRQITMTFQEDSIKKFNERLQRAVTRTNNLTQAQQNLTNALNNANASMNTEANNVDHVNRQTQQATQTQKQHNEEVKKGGMLYDILGRSVGSFIARMAAYRAVYGGIRVIVNGFKEALATMKAVDAELVTVRKVTGFSDAEMAQIEKNAYAVATKYGSSAQDYTESVASFARAGYRDLSSSLAELSTKTQIVGDTTADIANQFLLSVDAAYKYQGSIEKLTAVLDGANEIDNKYATSIEKIAEGMGIVAPVAAQMHVGVDELAASLGVITAVTQRSGSEAARALRAIFLNIVGDTKTEIDEGVTWTTGEIAGLRDIIKVYAKDAYDAAQATGGIIDPMEAIAGLSKSLKDGLLTEAELMEMVSDIGGKLRTSQLLALINNWDMYESMLADYRDAYGSADKEIDNAMNSWERKMNVLKNTWTEFVKTLIKPEQIKKILDVLIDFVKHLDSLPKVIMRITVAYVGLKLPQLVKSFQEGKTAVAQFFQALTAGESAANSAAGFIGLLAIAITAVISAISYFKKDYELQQQEMADKAYEAADAAQQDADAVLGLSKELEFATAGTDDFNTAAQNLAQTLGTTLPDSVDETVKKLRELSLEQLAKDMASTNTAALTAGDQLVSASGKAIKGIMGRLPFSYANIENYDPSRLDTELSSRYGLGMGLALMGVEAKLFSQDAVNRGEGQYAFYDTDTAEKAAAYREAMQEVVDIFNEYILTTGNAELRNDEFFLAAQKYLADTSEAYAEYENRQKSAFDVKTMHDFLSETKNLTIQTQGDLESFIASIEDSTTYTEKEKAAIVALAIEYYKFDEEVAKSAETLKVENLALGENERALDANATAAERAAAAKKDAEAAVRKLIPAMLDENGQLTAAAQAAFKMDSNLAGMVKTELEAQAAAKQANYSNLVAQIAAVGGMAAYARLQIEMMGKLTGNPLLDGLTTAAMAAKIAAQLAMMKVDMQNIANVATSVGVYVPSSGSGSGSGGGGSSSSSQSTEDKRLTALKERVTLLKSEYNLMKERGDSDEDLIAKMREIEKALRDEAAYLESIGGDRATINDLLRDAWSYHNQIEKMLESEAEDAEKQAEAIQKALDAQIALNNALSNRNVRVYNAATGQWEWTANPSSVQSALEAYQSAVSGFTSDDYAQLAARLAEMGASGSTDIIKNLLSAPGGSTISNLGNNHYGNNYNFAGMTFTEAQAKSMTLYDLAQLSGNLTIYR